jgi:hypothetical protein
MEDVLEVYTRPYDPRHPVVCLDETSTQLLRQTRDPLPVAPKQTARIDAEYERGGVVNLFLVCEPLTGRRWVEVTEQRTATDWAHQIKQVVDERFPEAERIILVQDNLNVHTPASLYATFPPAEARRLVNKLEVHATPKHGSWLNMAEIEFSVLSRQCLKQRVPDRATLQANIAAWQRRRARWAGPITGRFTTYTAPIKNTRLYPSYDK